MFNYFQGIMLTALEMICCKMFFEIFGEKRSEHNWKNYGLILGLILSMYSFALLFYEKFVLKQVILNYSWHHKPIPELYPRQDWYEID